MSERVYLRCTVCGNLRSQAAFGIDEDGEVEPREHETGLMVQSFHGDRGIKWEERPIPLSVARAQLACLRAAVERLEVEIQAVEEDD